MLKLISLVVCILILSGCTGKELKETGSLIGKSNPVGVLIALPIYGVGVLMEDKENEEKKLQDDEKSKNNIINLNKQIVEESKNVDTESIITEETRTVETKSEIKQ